MLANVGATGVHLNGSRQSADRPISGPVRVSLGATIGALLYASIAGELHVYAHEWIDFPILALPWVVFLAFGLIAGLRALSERGATWLGRLLTWASLVIVGVQILAGASFVMYLIATSCFGTITRICYRSPAS